MKNAWFESKREQNDEKKSNKQARHHKLKWIVSNGIEIRWRDEEEEKEQGKNR